jgi:hypothetical protein
MAATPPLALYTPAPDFRLPGTDGRTYAFDDIAGESGTVIVFISTHCGFPARPAWWNANGPSKIWSRNVDAVIQ